VAIRSGMLAAIGLKAVVGGAVVAHASGGAAAAAIKASHDKPANWGQHVVQTVRDCKQQRSGDPGQSQGIGHCVSAVAKQHGKQQSALKADPTSSAKATPTAMPGKRVGQQSGTTAADAHGGGQGQANGQGSGATHGQGAAASGQQTTAKGQGQPPSAPSPHA
jgi:hypothetical protein